MKFNLFKIRKNKKFNYSPRYSKSENQSNTYELDSMYVKGRTRSVYDKSNNWKEARIHARNRSNSFFSKTVIFIVLILTLIFLYIIDFDLSIFLNA